MEATENPKVLSLAESRVLRILNKSNSNGSLSIDLLQEFEHISTVSESLSSLTISGSKVNFFGKESALLSMSLTQDVPSSVDH